MQKNCRWRQNCKLKNKAYKIMLENGYKKILNSRRINSRLQNYSDLKKSTSRHFIKIFFHYLRFSVANRYASSHTFHNCAYLNAFSLIFIFLSNIFLFPSPHDDLLPPPSPISCFNKGQIQQGKSHNEFIKKIRQKTTNLLTVNVKLPRVLECTISIRRIVRFCSTCQRLSIIFDIRGERYNARCDVAVLANLRPKSKNKLIRHPNSPLTNFIEADYIHSPTILSARFTENSTLL